MLLHKMFAPLIAKGELGPADDNHQVPKVSAEPPDYEDENPTIMGGYLKSLGNKVEVQCSEAVYESMSGHVDSAIEQLVLQRTDGQSLSDVSCNGTASHIDCFKELERQLGLHNSCIGVVSIDAKPPRQALVL